MTAVSNLADQFRALNEKDRARLLQQLGAGGSSFASSFSFAHVGEAGMAHLAEALRALAGSLSGERFESISHAAQHLIGLVFVRLSQPPVVERQRWVEAFRALNRLYSCTEIDQKKVPEGFDLDPLLGFLEDLVEDRIPGVVFEGGQRESLQEALAYLRECSTEGDSIVLIGREDALPDPLDQGEKVLHLLHARYISLQGVMQHAVRLANPRLDALSLAIAVLKNNADFSQKSLEALLRAQDAAAFLLGDKSLRLQIGSEDLTKPWHEALQRLKDMPLAPPYPFAKVKNPLKRGDILEIEEIFERVATLNEGAMSTAARRARSLTMEITTICLGILVERLAELPIRLMVATAKFYLSLPLRIAYLARNLLISK